MRPRILIIDDEEDMLSTCAAALRGIGAEVLLESDSRKARSLLRSRKFEIIVTDIRLGPVDGISLLKTAKLADPETPVIVITAHPEIEIAIDALRAGATDFILKPFHPDDLKRRVARALEERRLVQENILLSGRVEGRGKPTDIIGASTPLLQLLATVEKAAPTKADVLLLGESGTGKELVARMLHVRSGRSGRFVPIDCGAIPENLLENEFFGHERGAFTGADASTPGLLEFADGGTFFMDEIGELPPNLQVKLLRVIQERQFRRLGGSRTIDVDIRVVAATNRDLAKEVRAGRFREDLYFRLNVISLRIPSLRERKEDIPLLVRHYLPIFARDLGLTGTEMTNDALESLVEYPWPGNVRELQNFLKRALIAAGSAPIQPEHLPESVFENGSGEASGEGSFQELRRRNLSEFEKRYFGELMSATSGNVREAARRGKVPLSNLYFFLKKHGLSPKAFRD